MLSVELSHLADVLDAAGQGKNISQSARDWSSKVHDAIWNTTVSPSFPSTPGTLLNKLCSLRITSLLTRRMVSFADVPCGERS